MKYILEVWAYRPISALEHVMELILSSCVIIGFSNTVLNIIQLYMI